jgi:hypothetical protein
MLALGLWRDSRCRGCGGDLAETTAEEHSGDPGRAGYRPLLPVRCHRCTALSASEHTYRDERHPHALIHRVELRPDRRKPPS